MTSPASAAGQRLAKTREAAEQGDAKAQYRLAEIYARGTGVPRDKAEAAKWYRAAAKQGHAEAQCHLGWMYDIGDGVPRDQTEAAKWYRTAAEQGDARAQYHLGVVYANGGGVSQDYAEAYKWFSLAGAEDTPDRLDVIRKKTTPTQVAEGKKRAAEFRPKKPGESTPSQQTTT
ncbi:MAG: hypothetical protein A3K19_27510 [Lentisphaerae bacterium RIFOXYB12_FULL_65_16]|nr:MAG: hypothetical protein A3K18_06355 [Lentisphaerae bacterium RIFOXYA12_64_32]OGV86460.1 MAG: hypothetical protein A3K19_27510 [Lentisphaerae bacterium RIFOXYB12_FULL_65_16]